MNGQGIPCGRNSSYSFLSIILKLHWCFGHGLKICMWFWYNPQIIFCCFFRKLNLAIFRALSITMWMASGYLVGATPPTVLYRFFWSCTGVSVMVWRYACGLDISLRLILSYKTSAEHFITFSSILPLQCYQYHQCLYICSTFECKYSYSFIQFFMKHLYVLMSWPEDMDMLWIKFLSFVSVFCSVNLSCSKIVHIDKKWRGT